MDNSFISPVANPRQSGPNKLVLLGGIVALLIAVIIGFFMILGSSSGPTDTVNRANERLKVLNELVTSGQENAESADLRKITAEAAILLSGDVTEFAQAAASVGVKENAEIIQQESETELLERLTTAAINGQFDAAFVPELIEKYESTSEIMESLMQTNISDEVQGSAERILTHNEAMLSQLRQLNL